MAETIKSRPPLDRQNPMILLDTNIFIYLANGTLDINALKNNDLAFASITKIEALGFSKITAVEQNYLEEIFQECEQVDLTEDIIRMAIKLRQISKMTLGDSIVAASAIENDCVLWTANTEDFEHLDHLRLHNPLI